MTEATEATGATEVAAPTTPFDHAERRIWSGKAEVYADTYARLCAHLVRPSSTPPRWGPEPASSMWAAAPEP
ncbi:hypothetical protein ACIBQ3_29365 [Streptomyces rubiginosohelvolus]|uniref:hypothetical protein n=1 Tax=Streptomyces rubiginosohelvolus TaxID=67362 RepID=UPI00378D6DC1